MESWYLGTNYQNLRKLVKRNNLFFITEDFVTSPDVWQGFALPIISDLFLFTF